MKYFYFSVEEGQLFQRGFNYALPRCLAGDEMTRASKEVHAEVYDEHQVGFRLFKQLIWVIHFPTIEVDAASLARRCQAFQINSNKIHAIIVELHGMVTSQPFHTQAFDLISPINPPSRDHIWILATMDVTLRESRK